MLTMPQVPACRLFMTLRLGGGSQPLQRRSGQLPSAFGHSGAITDLERAALGIAPVQKISVCAEILRLHRIKLCLLIAPLWGVSEEGGHGAYHHSPYFWDNVLESRQALPPQPALAMQVSGERGPGTWLAQVGLCPSDTAVPASSQISMQCSVARKSPYYFSH